MMVDFMFPRPLPSRGRAFFEVFSTFQEYMEDLLFTRGSPWVAGEYSLHCEVTSDEDSVGLNFSLPILRARGFKGTESIGVEKLQETMIRGERGLVQCDAGSQCFAWEMVPKILG